MTALPRNVPDEFFHNDGLYAILGQAWQTASDESTDGWVTAKRFKTEARRLIEPNRREWNNDHHNDFANDPEYKAACHAPRWTKPEREAIAQAITEAWLEAIAHEPTEAFNPMAPPTNVTQKGS